MSDLACFVNPGPYPGDRRTSDYLSKQVTASFGSHRRRLLRLGLRRSLKPRLQGDDNLAYLLIAFEVSVGFDGLIEGESPGDLRLERSVRQAIVDVFLHSFPLRGATQFVEGVAKHAYSSGKSGHGEGCGLAREHAVQEDGATIGRGLSERVDVIAAYRIEDDACTLAAGDRLHTGHQVLLFRDDDVVGAKGYELLFFGGGPGGRNRDTALCFYDLDRRNSNGRADR